MPSFIDIVDPTGDVRPIGVAIDIRGIDDQTVEPVNFATEYGTSKQHE